MKMKNRSRTFNKLSSALASDRQVDFELISEDQPLDSRHSLHRHECHQLRIRIPAEKSEPIHIVVIYPRVCHCNLLQKDYDRYYIWLLDKKQPDFSYPFKLEGTLIPQCLPPLIDALDELRVTGTDVAAAREKCRAQLVRLVQQDFSQLADNYHTDTKVQWLIRRFRNHYYRSDLSVMREAKYAGLSPNYVQKVFFRETHQTPKAFLTQIRLEMAARFLAEDRYQVQAVAAMCGYKSVANFSYAFRRYYGCVPGAYLKKNGSNDIADITDVSDRQHVNTASAAGAKNALVTTSSPIVFPQAKGAYKHGGFYVSVTRPEQEQPEKTITVDSDDWLN